MYVADIVIFANDGQRSMRALMQVLNCYFSKHISVSRKCSILRFTGFFEGSFPFKYIGVPIVVGRLKACDFGDLIGKSKKKIEG